MNEYQILVIKNGVFFFRTEWDSDELRARLVYKDLKDSLSPSIYEIRVYKAERGVSEVVSFS